VLPVDRTTYTARDGQQLSVDPRTGFVSGSTSKFQAHIGRNISRAHGTRTRREILRPDGSVQAREDRETLTLDAAGPVSLMGHREHAGGFMAVVWFLTLCAALVGGSAFLWSVFGGAANGFAYLAVAGWWGYAYWCCTKDSRS
jgi:hypothetical protein